MPTKSLPGIFVRSAALLIDITWKALNIKTQPPLSRIAAAMMSSNCTLNITKAKTDLGYSPLFTVDEGLQIMKLAH